MQKNTARGEIGRLKDVNANDIIQHLFQNSKPPAPKVAVLTEKAYRLNGFYTRLLEINRQSFRLEDYGLRHASGILFKLDRQNYQEAAKFLYGGVL